MNLSDPVDAAALRMYNETHAYVIALKKGQDPSAIPMIEATGAYARAVDASLVVTSDQRTWLRVGDNPGYDRHIDELVAAWHDSDVDDRPLHEFLFMTWDQYKHYMKSGYVDGLR